MATEPSGAARMSKTTSRAGMSRGKPSDAALGGMQPHLQSIESKPPVDLDDQLTVEDEPLRGK